VLSGANLSGLDLSSVCPGLTQEQIDSAVINEETKLLEYLQEGAIQGPGGEPNA
jgi:hypothetical protein